MLVVATSKLVVCAPTLKSSPIRLASNTADVLHTTAIQGGETLIVEAATAHTLAIYALDGRCVKHVALRPGKNTISLPNGIYIVENIKVTISK